MIGRYGFHSLRFKLVLASTLVEAVLLTLLVANSVRLMNNSLAEQTQIRLEELAPLFNASLAPPLVQRDYAALQDILEGIVQAKGLVYIQAIDHRGARVARAGRAPEVFRRDADLGGAGADEIFDQEQSLALSGQALGKVQFGISTAPMAAAGAAIVNQGVGIALLEIAATFALLTALGVLLTRNLLTLAQAARRVEGGDLDVALEVPGRDEVADTAHAFNQMVAALKRDISEREQLLAELTAKNAEMESFVYTISHDLKSPLITIGGFVGVLEKDIARGDRKAVREDLAEIRRATVHMQTLIDDLLALSRTGRIVGEPEPTDLPALLAGVEQRLQNQIVGTDATIELAPGLPRIAVDRKRFAQVLENLIDNAIKFRRPGVAPFIRIGGGLHDGELRLSVRDNGKGLDPAYHERIFVLFERADAETEGTGVGLAIARRIVEVHGGRLWVESSPGQGSVFWIALPQSVIVRAH